ncbi:MAG TPA: hypothetical protein VH025_02895, partial [Solirubrobacteraceae bacterium]|nr:hypothetical protein [Solirubrobacteraceae bacterium]
GGGSSSEASTGVSSLLPQALASAIASDGGLGLAAQITREQQRFDGSATTGGTSGTSGATAA